MRYSGLSISEGATEWLYYFHLNFMNKFIRTKEVLFSLHYMSMEIIIVSFCAEERFVWNFEYCKVSVLVSDNRNIRFKIKRRHQRNLLTIKNRIKHHINSKMNSLTCPKWLYICCVYYWSSAEQTLIAIF